MILRQLLTGLFCLMLSSIAAADDFPSREITVVVPFSPGGTNDIMARYLSQELSQLWKVPSVVENRGGGGTAIGASHVAKSNPDGHVLLFTSTSYTLNAALRNDLPFDPIKDLVPVAMIATGDVGVIVGKDTGIKSLEDLARASKERDLFYATAGVGSSQHFNAELLAKALGINMEALPYPGAAEGLVDLLGGRVDVIVGSVGGMLSTMEQGAVPIAVLGQTRSSKLPDVPTVAEAGYPDATTQFYWTVYAPAETPPETVDKLHEGIVSVFSTPKAATLLSGLDAKPSSMSRKDVQDYVVKDISYWTDLAKQLELRE
jgi:Uncharacterized protein conserved in bacteria